MTSLTRLNVHYRITFEENIAIYIPFKNIKLTSKLKIKRQIQKKTVFTTRNVSFVNIFFLLYVRFRERRISVKFSKIHPVLFLKEHRYGA